MTTSVSTATPTPEIFFYHSFPRHHKHDDAHRTLALSTLRSILKNGLLLTAEEFPQPENFPVVDFVQRRTCFTALHPSALKRHFHIFGTFNIEFKLDILRAFGAQPAFYLAAPRTTVDLLNYAGAETAYHLFEAFQLLTNLWTLRDRSPVQIVTDYAKAYPNETPCDITKVSQLKAAAEIITGHLWQKPHAFQHMVFGLETLLNLYYRTDEPSSDPLRFFEQREWKITPNFSADKTWHYEPLTDVQKAELCAINPKFFDALVGGRPRIDQCSYFARIGTRHIVQEASRLIVPDDFVDAVRVIVDEAVTAGHLTMPLAIERESNLPDNPPPFDPSVSVPPCRGASTP